MTEFRVAEGWLHPALPASRSPACRDGAAEDAASKRSVLEALTRKFSLAGDVDLGDLAARCPPQLTGADMYALCADAWMNGLKRLVATVRRLACWLCWGVRNLIEHQARKLTER